MRIGLAQIEPIQGSITKNTEKILEHVDKAEQHEVDLLVTPELATIGYGCGDIFLDKVDENLEALKQIKEEIKGFYAIIGYVEKDENGFLYNSAALIKDREMLGNYRKVQLVNYRLFDEKRYFKHGNSCPVFETEFGKIGVLICEDLWYPEPARALTFRGASLIACISASPYEAGKPDAWNMLLKQRVNDNLVYMAFVNQVGCQDGVTYWGASKVLNPAGIIVTEADLISEDFVATDIDLKDVERVRRRDLRCRDIRREIIEDVLKAYEARENASFG